jgi:tryptophanyl-tRNA synthetase
MLYALIHDQNPKDVASELKHNTYSEFKMKLAHDLNKHLAPFREKRLELEAKPHYVKEILDMGRARVTEKAEETLRLVREAMKINY